VHASTDEETIEQITAEFPGWRVSRARRHRPRSSIASQLYDAKNSMTQFV
jgi:hypothetical protein